MDLQASVNFWCKIAEFAFIVVIVGVACEFFEWYGPAQAGRMGFWAAKRSDFGL